MTASLLSLSNLLFVYHPNIQHSVGINLVIAGVHKQATVMCVKVFQIGMYSACFFFLVFTYLRLGLVFGILSKFRPRSVFYGRADTNQK